MMKRFCSLDNLAFWFAAHSLYQTIERPQRWLMGLLIGGGLGSIVVEHGFWLTPPLIALFHTLQQGMAWGSLALYLLALLLMSRRQEFLKKHRVRAVVMGFLLLDLILTQTALVQRWLPALLPGVPEPQALAWRVAALQVAIVLVAVLEGAYYSQRIATWQLRPAQLLVLSFAGLILLGSLLLLLPRATSQPGALSLLHAVFTATSAVCVTGLIVVDTATIFTPLGQGIIIGLCQLGGLGIITFATVFSMLVRGDIGIREKLLLQELAASRQFRDIRRTIQRIVWLTVTLEILGAMSLYGFLGTAVPNPGRRAWVALFHAISAFCNAGFSTFSAGLANADTAMHLGVNLTVIVLIILGGLGFSVLWDGGLWVGGRCVRRRHRLMVQSRLVLLSSGLLLIGGAAVFLLLEAEGVLAGQSKSTQVLGALFQSVTARTAGFNTLPIEQLTTSGALCLILLMLIGASPGSTGGGLKTTTVAVLLMTAEATMRGRARVEAFRRTVPWENINQAYATFFFSIVVITVSLFLLSIVEHHAFLDLFFEEVSAFATVGLSRGITASLSPIGKGVIIVSMFVGRVGSLTLGMALARQVRTRAYEYPTEAVMVG